jgi:hypothetical protein
MSQSPADPSVVVGKTLDDPDVIAFLAALDPKTKSTVNEEGEPEWFSKVAGVEIRADTRSRRIKTIHMFAEGEDGYRQYAGPLPHGMSYTMKKDDVKARFTSPPKLTSPQHDTWDFEDYRIIVMYNKATGQIKRVSLTKAV